MWYNLAMNKQKLIKTIHDISLGFFVNAGYGITQGGDVFANGYVLAVSIILIYFTNKGD